MRGDWPLKHKTQLVGGHEGIGVVVAKGDLAKGVDIGDYVGIKWLNGSCLSCAFCINGDEPQCPDALLSGYTVDGTFQQYATGKAMHLTQIPKDCDLSAAAPILCAGLTVYKGLKESGARPAQFVAVIGAGGGLGSLALQYAKAMGLRTIAVDAGEAKGKFCTSLGADAYVDFTKSNDLVKDIKAATPDGLGPHAALVIAAKEGPFHKATEYVRPRGTVVCIGMPKEAQIKASVFDVVVRMLSIKGSYVGNRADANEAVEIFRAGLVKAPVTVVPLSKLSEVFDAMASGDIIGRYVLDTSK